MHASLRDVFRPERYELLVKCRASGSWADDCSQSLQSTLTLSVMVRVLLKIALTGRDHGASVETIICATRGLVLPLDTELSLEKLEGACVQSALRRCWTIARPEVYFKMSPWEGL